MFYVDISLNVCVRTFPCTSIIVEAITIIMDPTHKSTSTNLHLLLPVNVSKDNNVLCPVSRAAAASPTPDHQLSEQTDIPHYDDGDVYRSLVTY